MSRLPRLARAIRWMHTEGRQIDHQGPSTTPALHGHIPRSATITPHHIDQPQIIDPIPAPLPISGRPTHTPKGRPIPRRPAREIPVNLPSGYPEPPSYPPPKEYFDGLDERRKPIHPLWGFFHTNVSARQRLKEDAPIPKEMGSLDVSLNEDKDLHSGRSWTAEELRRKSFKDLHTLWYILLKERNVLATQKEERRRLNIGSRIDGELITKRAFRCRKSMARIKYVLNERRLGFIAAAGPELAAEAPHVPWSASVFTDPAGATEAIRGELEVPLHVLQPRAKGSQAQGRGQSQGKGADESFVESEEVSEAEVDARDEGFGGGKEAEEFVRDVEVEDGKVEKK